MDELSRRDSLKMLSAGVASLSPAALNPADASSQGPAGVPLLALDMYEHAFHMDYGAAAKYVEAFMQSVKWEEVNRRYDAARKAVEPMKN